MNEPNFLPKKQIVADLIVSRTGDPNKEEHPLHYFIHGIRRHFERETGMCGDTRNNRYKVWAKGYYDYIARKNTK